MSQILLEKQEEELIKKRKQKPKIIIVEKDEQKLLDQLFSFLEKVPLGASAFQIKNFILSKAECYTPDGQYWQAKLELYMRLQNLIQQQYEYNKHALEIEKLLTEIREFDDKQRDEVAKGKDVKPYLLDRYNIEKAIRENEIEFKRYQMLSIRKVAADKVKEMRAFFEKIQEVEPKMKHSKDEKEAAELDYWLAKKAKLEERGDFRLKEMLDASN